MLDKIHERHQGVVKCREWAHQAVWWPGLSTQIRELVLKCRQCIEERVNVKESLMPTDFLESPWQKLGAEKLFVRSLLIDYFSVCIEIQ